MTKFSSNIMALCALPVSGLQIKPANANRPSAAEYTVVPISAPLGGNFDGDPELEIPTQHKEKRPEKECVAADAPSERQLRMLAHVKKMFTSYLSDILELYSAQASIINKDLVQIVYDYIGEGA